MKVLFTLCVCLALFACPVAQPVTKCDPVDSGMTTTEPVDAGPDYEVQFRFVNLGREPVTVQLEGEDAGLQVPSLGSLAKTGHVTLIKQRGTVAARNLLDDGGVQPLSLPFEFDTTTGEAVTMVLKDSTPARISTNMTVARQTQGTSFGERVRQGLANVEIEGGVETSGDCVADFAAPEGTMARVGLHNEPPGQDCDGTADNEFVRPGEVDVDATPYFVHGPDEVLQVAWVSKVNQGLHAAGGALASGASLLGGALPGGAVISAALSQMYVLNVHSTRSPASVSIDGVSLVQDLPSGTIVRVKSSALSAAARKGIQENGIRRTSVANVSVGASAGTVPLGGVVTGPCRPPYLCDFMMGEDTLLVVSDNLLSSATVLKARHETAKNSVGNIRRVVAFGSTSSLDTRACVSVLVGDDTCIMGAAQSSASLGAGGGAAAASYAATGRLLYPPKGPPAQGTSMVFGYAENGVVARRFTWDSPRGLTPEVGAMPEGFAIVTDGTSMDAAAVDKRALFFVQTATRPWTVLPSLSK